MYQKNDYIAVFDSGVGGISVLRELVKRLPNERFLYYGDFANAPYGSKTTEQVRELTRSAAKKILCKPVKALVVACNTATAAAIDTLRQEYPELIVIGIEPALKLAVDCYPNKRIGVMATEVTLREEKFDALLQRFADAPAICKISAPGLVELVERGKADSQETNQLLCDILSPYVGKIDVLVLGCTHYPFVKDAISRVLGNDVVLLDGGEGTARETKRRLALADLLSDGTGGVVWENSSENASTELCKLLLAK